MSKQGELLVAILNDPSDFRIARDRHWYRIPLQSANKWLRDAWPPKWIAFYQTKAFGREAHSINYYARVLDIRTANRRQLLPEHPESKKSNRLYHQIFIEPLNRLPMPIFSRRWRRIVFIPTTRTKFSRAVELNDLFYGSSLEDRLWAELKRLKIQAERQEFARVKNRGYFLDFAVYCARGQLDIETDGDAWHHTPERAQRDINRLDRTRVIELYWGFG